MAEYLITVVPHDGSAEHPLYWGTAGYQTGFNDDPAGVYFEDRIADPGNFDQHLWSEGSTRGASSVSAGDVVIVRLDNGAGDRPDAWLSWHWKGRPITIRRWNGVGRVADAEIVFAGSCRRLTADGSTYVLQIKDLLSDLDEPMLTDRFAGTSTGPGLGVEGNEDLQGQIKQNCYGGPNYSVPIQWANPYDNIGQVSNRPVHEIVLLDGGVALTHRGDKATLAELVAADVNPATENDGGEYVTCNTLGLFKAGGSANKLFTANVTEGATAADRTMAQIARRMMNDYGIADSDLDLSTFTALDAANAGVCAAVVSNDESARSAIMRVLGSDLGFLIHDELGQYQVGRLELPAEDAPVASLDESQIGEVDYVASSDSDNGDPVGRVLVRYAEVKTTLQGSQAAGVLTGAERAFFEAQWRTSAPAESAAVLARDPLAPEITIDSCFVNKADADAAATRALAIYSERRTFARVPIPDVGGIEDVRCNSVIALTLDDLEFEADKPFRVLGRVLTLADETATLIVWA